MFLFILSLLWYGCYGKKNTEGACITLMKNEEKRVWKITKKKSNFKKSLFFGLNKY